MIEGLGHIHLNILFLLGLALFGGTVGGRLFQRLHIPQVVGYIAIGVLIGQSGFKFVDKQTLTMLEPFSYFALGLIGFMVGGELHRTTIAKYGKQFMVILFCEGAGPFFLVTLSVGIFGSFLLPAPVAWALGVLLGSIASATDPATTNSVLKEFKSRGPLTTIITAIVALDDALALTLFVIAQSIAGILIGEANTGILSSLLKLLYELGGSLAMGAILGFILARILVRYAEEERLLAFTIGIVLLLTGISMAFELEMLLVAMTVGVIVTNFTHKKSEEIFKLVGGFTPPIYVLFFVLIGAKLNVSGFSFTTFVLMCLYLFGTVVGKSAGSFLGAIVSKAGTSVKMYLPWALFSQAGVAIGLSVLLSQYFPGEIGETIVIVVTATTFLLQIVGPPLTKFSIFKAKEAGLDITEADLIRDMTAKDVMEKNPPKMLVNMPLGQILKIFSESDGLYYPVIDEANKLIGVITVDNLKKTVSEAGELNNLLVAHDVMQPVTATVDKNTSVERIRELFRLHNIESLAVVSPDKVLEGFIERWALNRLISTKIIELNRKIDILEDNFKKNA